MKSNIQKITNHTSLTSAQTITWSMKRGMVGDYKIIEERAKGIQHRTVKSIYSRIKHLRGILLYGRPILDDFSSSTNSIRLNNRDRTEGRTSPTSRQ